MDVHLRRRQALERVEPVELHRHPHLVGEVVRVPEAESLEQPELVEPDLLPGSSRVPRAQRPEHVHRAIEPDQQVGMQGIKDARRRHVPEIVCSSHPALTARTRARRAPQFLRPHK